MMHVNRESAIPIADLHRIKLKRIKRGECPDCGTTLYKTTTGMLGRVKKSTPLNEEGKCYDGRCLVCLPLHPNEVSNHHSNNNDENQNNQNGQNTENVTRPNVATQPQSQEMKKAPTIPRIILIYQSCAHDSMMQNVFNHGTLPESFPNSGSKTDLGLFGLDLNDDVSEITLDRRIRQNSSKSKSNMNITTLYAAAAADQNLIKNDYSSHRDDDDDDDDENDHVVEDDDDEEYVSEKSCTKQNKTNHYAISPSDHVAAVPEASGAIMDSMQQENYRNKMNLLFSHAPISTSVIDHNEPLHIRMARLLEVDLPNGNKSSHIPDEELDSEPYILDNMLHQKDPASIMHGTNYEIRFNNNIIEQPLILSTRKLESAEDSVDGMDEDDNNDDKHPDDLAAAIRKQSVQDKQRKIGLFHSPRQPLADNGVQSASSSRRIFRPENLFVSPPTYDQNHEQQIKGSTFQLPNITVEKPMSSIAIEPDSLLEKTPHTYGVSKPVIQVTDQQPEIFFDLTCSTTTIDPQRSKIVDTPNVFTPTLEKQAKVSESGVISPTLGHGTAGDRHNSALTKSDIETEIVFDLTAITSLVDHSKHTKERSHCGGEASHVTDDSLMGFGTENSSSQNHDTEYSAYSSKLLMMLEGTDAENDYSTGSTWPSLRIPRIKADMDDLTSALQSYSNKNETVDENVTGDVYQETGIPKVVYSSSTTIECKNTGIIDAADENNGTRRLLDNETQRVHRVSPIPIPLPSPKKSPNPSSAIGTVLSSQKAHPIGADLSPTSNNTVTVGVEPCDEIDNLLLQLDKKLVKDCGSVLSRLTDLLWMSNDDPNIRQHFVRQNGAVTLATTMWASMSFPCIEEAAFRLFFALIAVQQTEEINLDKWNDDLAGLIDAQLIAMQTIISDKEIQKLGCRIFCCLASQKGNENDGSQSGACLAVLNAMDAHGTAEDMQEWGLRTLYNQCVFSQYADTNKRVVMASKLDTSGSTCFEVLERIVRRKAYHMRTGGVMEWLYRLYWSLTAGIVSTSDIVPLRLDSIRELLMMLEACRTATDVSPQLQEAGLGLIANLMRVDYYKSFLGTPDVVLLILDTMRGNKEFVDVQIEACNAIANIAIILAPVDKEELIEAGIIRTIVGAMYAFPGEKVTLLEPVLRALLGLARESESAKTEICEAKTLSVIMQISGMDHDSTQPQQELLCKLLASLYSSDRLLIKAVQFDTIGALTAAMSAFRKSEKISDAGCCAYRNLSRSDGNFDVLMKCNAIGFVVHAMMANVRSTSIQMNGCWVLWNLGVGTEGGPHKIASVGAMKEIVIAIQTHLDSYEVIDVACGTLWGLMHRSNVLFQDFFESPSGLESLVCTLVMHPDKIPLLEKVCGILAYGSRNVRDMPADVISSGVGNVIETMSHNPRSSMILQHGAHFLRNVVAVHFEYATECVNVIAVLMDALVGPDVPIPFLGEILYFLWVMAEISNAAKTKIITMEGIPIAMSILDQFRGGRVPFVEDPALGLFKELAGESSHSQRG